MNIYNPQGNVILSVVPSDDSTRVRRIRSENYALLNYSLPEYIEIPVGSYTDYRGQRYTLWRPEDFTKQGSRIWDYAVKFGGPQ